MKRETLKILRCPEGCAGELSPGSAQEENGRIITGHLDCSVCGNRYPIEEGIARLLPVVLQETKAAAELTHKQSEMAARDAQVEDYDKMRGLALFGKIEIPVTLSYLKLGSEDVLLEAGCGTGRMTPTFAARCRTLVAADFSFESLRVCRRKLLQAGITNVDWIQADVCALPLRGEQFSKVVSCQVLEHVPTPESRARMVAELARVSRSGSDIVISAYKHSLYTKLFDKKEGMHTGGIYYYRFHRRELYTLLSNALTVQNMTGALVYHYLARCRKV
jgi:ubiquinone/menaquinone biosynthesis C-methylase UbiE/uncharacterized protein YbaR (Trm112 family)